MSTFVVYVVVLATVAGAFFVVASAVFGRGEELAPLPPGTTPTVLPESDVTGADVRDLRFQQVLRGYRADEVDWALARLAGEIDGLRAEVTRLGGAPGPTDTLHGAGSDATMAPDTTMEPPTGPDEHERLI